jgi:CRP-like cAMP-binding protein
MSAAGEANFNLLKTIFPFYLLTDETLQAMAVAARRRAFNPGETVFAVDQEAEFLGVVVSGTIRLRGKRNNTTKDLAFLTSGDLFGLEALGNDGEFKTLALCESRSVVLMIPRQSLHQAAAEEHIFKRVISMLHRSDAFSRRVNLPWLTPDEPILLVSRRHPFVLITRLALWGTLSLALFAFLLYQSFMSTTTSGFLLFLAILALCVGSGVTAWSALEWSNDYVIVTRRRVTMQRQMVGFYEGRQESPWEAVLSVALDTTAWSRVIGYGTVTVRAYTGDLRLERLPEPDLVFALLETTRQRLAVDKRRDDQARIREALTSRLEKRQSPAGKLEKKSLPADDGMIYRSGSVSDFLARFFGLRFVSQGGITYHTHWMILLRRTFLPALLLILVAFVTLARSFGLITLLSQNSLYIIAIMGALLGWGWWLYQYIDWYNDIYMITPDQLVDISRKPLGHEDRRSAPLKNIQTVEYRRNGLIGLVFNYGTVRIQIGNEELTFDNVYNPSAIQKEIYACYAAFNERIKMNEQQRLADWIATYDEIVREQNRETSKKR